MRLAACSIKPGLTVSRPCPNAARLDENRTKSDVSTTEQIAQQPFLIPGFQQLMHHCGRRRETHPMAPLASRQAEGAREVRLARAGVAQQQHVLAAQPERFRNYSFHEVLATHLLPAGVAAKEARSPCLRRSGSVL